MAPQIGKAESEHAAGKGYEAGACDDSQDAEQGARRHFGRDRRRGGARDL
jgi:hypothetical protein